MIRESKISWYIFWYGDMSSQNKMNKSRVHCLTSSSETRSFLSHSACLYDLIETRTNVNETFQFKSSAQLFKVAARAWSNTCSTIRDVFNATYAKSERIQWFRSWAWDLNKIQFKIDQAHQVFSSYRFIWRPSPVQNRWKESLNEVEEKRKLLLIFENTKKLRMFEKSHYDTWCN